MTNILSIVPFDGERKTGTRSKPTWHPCRVIGVDYSFSGSRFVVIVEAEDGEMFITESEIVRKQHDHHHPRH